MKSIIYIDKIEVGCVKFTISDESMGALSGDFIPNTHYEKYQPKIQELTDIKGIANIDDFNFRIIYKDIELHPEGGIGITDLANLNEIIIEVVGIHPHVIKMITSSQ